MGAAASAFECLLPVASFSLLAAYHYRFSKDSLDRMVPVTFIAHGLMSRERAIQHCVEKNDRICLVQAYRNVIILCSFFCTLCVGLMVSIFTVAVSDETDAEPTMIIDFESTYRATSRKLALLILAVNFIISIFNWMMALRYYNHLNYFFQSDTVAVAKLIIHRGQIHVSIGLRQLLMMFPLIAWTIGPTWFLASTIIFVAMLRRLDYRKQGQWVPHEEGGSG